MKLEIITRKKAEKSQNTCRLNNTLLNNTSERNFNRNFKIFWAKGILKYNLIKLTGAAKVMLREKFIALNAYNRKEKSKNQSFIKLSS